MTNTSLHDIIPVLQVAIGPVILISGVGLLLLTMTNRLGRAIDRARQLAKELPEHTGDDRARLLSQIATIYRRARLLRITIAFSVLSVLLAAVLIISLFLAAICHREDGNIVVLIFIACLSCLILSLATFIYDIHLSLEALRLELREVKPDLE